MILGSLWSAECCLRIETETRIFLLYLFINVVDFIDLGKVCLVPLARSVSPVRMDRIHNDGDLEQAIVYGLAIVLVDSPLSSCLGGKSQYQNTK